MLQKPVIVKIRYLHGPASTGRRKNDAGPAGSNSGPAPAQMEK
jgi:hypothetical protein